MLFPYVYVSHSMEKLQTYLDFIFFNVWCSAKGKEYDIATLFADHGELEAIITELHTSALTGANFFLTGLQQIFEEFKKLDDAKIDQLKCMYKANNDIEGVCSGCDDTEPVTYREISQLSPELSGYFKDFYQNLYSHKFLSLKSIKDRIGEIGGDNGHYLCFVEINNHGKCPFCGLHDMKGTDHSKREAYDHFLPKDKYPFNTINFHNLAPACNDCNSSYKLAKDPAFDTQNPLASSTGDRRRAFYPYSDTSYKIQLDICLDKVTDWTKIYADEIELGASAEGLAEEIGTWLDIYGIEERYKAKCCAENDGMGWIRQITDESHNLGQTPQEVLHAKLKTAENSPWVESNFLKMPFLEACNRAGVLDTLSVAY